MKCVLLEIKKKKKHLDTFRRVSPSLPRQPVMLYPRDLEAIGVTSKQAQVHTNKVRAEVWAKGAGLLTQAFNATMIFLFYRRTSHFIHFNV